MKLYINNRISAYYKGIFFFDFILKISILIATLSPISSYSQITLEDIWQKGTFRMQYPKGIVWSANDDGYYEEDRFSSSRVGIVKKSMPKDVVLDTLFDSQWTEDTSFVFEEFLVSPNENLILFTRNSTSIYRHSTVAEWFVWNKTNRSLAKLHPSEKIANVGFSPDQQKITFTCSNNLWYFDVAKGQAIQVTTTGKTNQIIHGHTDWVYEEEFSFTKAYDWSKNSQYLAFLSFDESQVPMYNMQTWNGLYPGNYTYKYPKAGEKNAVVKINVYDCLTGKTLEVPLTDSLDCYIPRLKFTQKDQILGFQTLNRFQNHWKLNHFDLKNQSIQKVLEEKSNSYVEIFDDFQYTSDGKSLVFASEKDGFKHLYFHTFATSSTKPITSGTWDVGELVFVDESKQKLYYTSKENSPLENQLYVVDWSGKNKTQVTKEKGFHQISISAAGKYVIDNFSNSSTPNATFVRRTTDGKILTTLFSNENLKKTHLSQGLPFKEFFTCPSANGEKLNGWMLKPATFDSTKKYPVLLYVYGGPGFQTVVNRWDGRDFYWYQYLCQQGYIIISVDGRGTGSRGSQFKKCTYSQLGKYELEDVVAVADYFKSLPYIDKNRLGIWGWSFGGYLSSLAMTKASGTFKMGIAVAPVTNWRWYDTIYTERFLKTPQDNAKGYDDNSPISYADKLKGSYLLIHGTGDDNVHFQHAVKMQEALIKAGKQFSSFYYPDKNHGISGGNTRFHLYKMMTDYILKNL